MKKFKGLEESGVSERKMMLQKRSVCRLKCYMFVLSYLMWGDSSVTFLTMARISQNKDVDGQSGVLISVMRLHVTEK